MANPKPSKTALCLKCEKQQPFRVLVQPVVYEECGRKYVVSGYAARCMVCGAEVDVEWVDELNYKTRVEAKKEYDRRCGKGGDRR